MKRWLLSLCLLSALVWAPPLGATEVPAATARQARAVIQSQLRALANDDAELAFSYAAGPLRQLFGNADHFIRTVRAHYAVVYRPASVVFLKPALVDGQLLQAVQMTDHDGRLWLVLYRVMLQPDKHWRIVGCQILRDDSDAV